MPAQAPMLQRRCACGGTPGPDGECAACKARRLGVQRRAAAAGPQIAPPIVHDVLRGPGRPLDPGVRGEMEARFEHDFSRVRVHNDTAAAASAKSVAARAYTVGSHVVFGGKPIRALYPGGLGAARARADPRRPATRSRRCACGFCRLRPRTMRSSAPPRPPPQTARASNGRTRATPASGGETFAARTLPPGRGRCGPGRSTEWRSRRPSADIPPSRLTRIRWPTCRAASIPSRSPDDPPARVGSRPSLPAAQ
jgi:hypothetical protein